jgi:mRNA interferase RelE/StbE
MAEYLITFNRSAEKELDSLDATLIRRIVPKIDALAKEPRPHGCRKLHGEKEMWRIRIGDYRVIYIINDAEHNVDITGVRHRSKAYE